MATAINYEDESTIVDADASLRLSVSAPEGRYVQVLEADGTIQLIPWSRLHESEQDIMEDQELHAQTRKGLSDFLAGRKVSSDWLFADE